MASINEIKDYVTMLHKQSLSEYNKLDNSVSLNHIPRDKLANSVLNKHLSALMRKKDLNEGDLLLITKEVIKKLIKVQ